MKWNKTSIPIFCMTIILLILSATGLSVHGQEGPFPTYGSGAVQVCIYTDYFCPPCRGMEPAVEPILRDLIKRNVILVTLIDMPFSSYSALYAGYFLYALNAKNDFEYALKVRNILFDAATRNVTTTEGIEELFRSKGIPFSAFEPKSAFDRYNALIKQDKIDATPTSVIIRRDGKKEKYIGGPDIVNALKGLK